MLYSITIENLDTMPFVPIRVPFEFVAAPERLSSYLEDISCYVRSLRPHLGPVVGRDQIGEGDREMRYNHEISLDRVRGAYEFLMAIKNGVVWLACA